MSGWIKIDRGIRGHWLWNDPRWLRWWVDLLLEAAYEHKEIEIGHRVFIIGRGCLVASQRLLQRRWADKDEDGNIRYPTRRTIAYFLDTLEKAEMVRLNRETMPRGTTLIEILNYSAYQGEDVQKCDGEPIVGTNCVQNSVPISVPINSDENQRDARGVSTSESASGSTSESTSGSANNKNKRKKKINNSQNACVREGACERPEIPAEPLKENPPAGLEEETPGPAAEVNFEHLRRFISERRIQIENEVMAFHRTNPKCQGFADWHAMACEVVNDWDMRDFTHRRYSEWVAHFVSTMKYKNQFYSKQNGNANDYGHNAQRQRAEEAARLAGSILQTGGLAGIDVWGDGRGVP